MNVARRVLMVSLLCGALLVMGGCQQHYLVTSTTNGKEYVTEQDSMSTNEYTGVIRFTDLKSGKFVVLREYEVEPITSDRARAIGGALEYE